MPIYQYKAVAKGCGCCGGGFEVMQSMGERLLRKCPQCGGKVKKIPSVCGGGTAMLSTGNLRDKGFTKLERRGDGTYEKVT